jgi:molecular chaperone DnaK (HSP70)
MRLGIDFGTTRTVVAVARDGRHPLVAFEAGDESVDYVPGVAALVAGAGGAGELVVGWPAMRAVSSGAATHAVRSIKRVAASLPPDEEVPGLPGVTALALVTAFLVALRRHIEDASNAEASGPLEVMISVPASASSRQRWLTLEAFRHAGFVPLGLYNEPTAAAIELAHRHFAELGPRSKKRYVVVYDLGGGTFDASAVSLDGRRFDLIATEGLSRLGGDDFDELILAAACESLGIPPRRDAASLERAREAKEGLRPASKKLLVDLGAAGAAQLDVADLYTRCTSLIDRTIAQTDLLFERLRDHGIDPDDARELGGVYLVGGAAAFPAVTRALRARFGKKLQLAPQPFASTAIGLALAADPGANVIVREAVTRHFGVWREGDAGADKVFDPLIGKGATAGVVERRYRPRHSVGHLRFVECGALDTNNQPVQDLVPWADILFPYEADVADPARLPIVRREQPLAEIAETYTYKPDGTISVTIANLVQNYTRTYELGALR